MRLNYELQMDGGKVLVRIKESIGNWLGLKPVRPRTGTFGDTVGLGGVQLTLPGFNSNNGKTYLLPPAGYEFQSFKFLLKPGTTIAEPVANCAENKTETRPICSFSIGFPRGSKELRITRWRVEKWINSTKRKDSVIGFITPSGVKHVWKGVMDSSPGLPGGLPNPNVGDIVGAGLGLLDGVDAGDIANVAGIVGGLLF